MIPGNREKQTQRLAARLRVKALGGIARKAQMKLDHLEA